MSDNKILRTYWEGAPFSNLELLSIQSFIQNGHTVLVYTYPKYNPLLKPFAKNMEILDVSEILPIEKRREIKMMSSVFSDLLRYYLLYKFGGWWVDLDIVLLKPINTENKIVIALHYMDKIEGVLQNLSINAAPLKLPKGHALASYCIRSAEMHDLGKANHADLGPRVLEKEVKRLKLENYLVSPEVYSPLGYHEASRVVESGFGFDRITPETVAVHLFNTSWDHGINEKNPIDKNGKYPEDSMYEHLKTRYGVL